MSGICISRDEPYRMGQKDVKGLRVSRTESSSDSFCSWPRTYLTQLPAARHDLPFTQNTTENGVLITLSTFFPWLGLPVARISNSISGGALILSLFGELALSGRVVNLMASLISFLEAASGMRTI
jgi:hypothetical protein